MTKLVLFFSSLILFSTLPFQNFFAFTSFTSLHPIFSAFLSCKAPSPDFARVRPLRWLDAKPRSGYPGAGPICLQRCRHRYEDGGAVCCKDILIWYLKRSYCRGVGNLPRYKCDSGLQRDTFLCHIPYFSGFKGVGLVRGAHVAPL